MSWYRPSLEKLGNLAFIAMCIAVTALGVQRLTAERAPTAGPPPPFEAGTRLALNSKLAPGGARVSAIIALSSNCQYCTASMPFYRRLADLPAAKDGRLKIGVVGIQSEAELREYMAGHGLAVLTVVELREAGVPVQATPTLLLVNADGAVTQSYSGRLRHDDEEAVVKEITRLSKL